MAYEELFSDIQEKLLDVGVEKGDMIYVASDIRYLLYQLVTEYSVKTEAEKDAALDMLTNHLQQAAGEEGTLLFPVFSWDFCRGKGFDYYKTQGEVGAYSNWILNHRRDFRRTQHPMYSFMVWGKEADKLCAMSNQDAWGEASPFHYMMRNRGKQLEFNVEAYRGLTFIHCIEQWVGVPYRHPKYFFGNYTDADGITEIRSYSMYVRDLDVAEHTKTTHQYLLDHNVAQKTVWKGNDITLIDIERCYNEVKEDIIKNNGANNMQFDDYKFQYGSAQTVPYEISAIPEN